MKEESVKCMNINQVGLYGQVPEKSNKVSKKSYCIGEVPKGSHISVGQSDIQNALASANNTYEKNVGVEEGVSVKHEKNKNTAEYFNDISNRMTAEDINDIEEEGMTLEKYNMERLDRTLNRIKKQKQFKEDCMESGAKKREQHAEDVERAVIHAATGGIASSQVAAALENSNLPVTEENIAKIAQAVSMAGMAGNLSDEAISYMISNELEPTISNIYQAEHVGKSMNVNSAINNINAYEAIHVAYDISTVGTNEGKEADWEKIKGQVEELLKANGFESENATMEDCKWLFEHDLPITEESIKSLQELKEIKNQVISEDITKETIRQYETGIEPENINLTTIKRNQTNFDLEDFLQNVEKQLASQDVDIEDITFHRQLEEIRLKMTSEVSGQLEDMGIQIDMEHISDIIDGLKELENSYYQGLFKDAGIDASEAEIELMKQTTEKISALTSMPSALLGKTFTTRMEESIDSLVEKGNELKSQLVRAEEAYETLGTEVRKDLGDSIKKAFQNISNILEDMGLEATEANIRAVKILGYNNIQITEHSINEMKYYDKQVQDLIDGLRPAVTMEMIHSGKNPLDMPIEQVNEQVAEIQKEIGISEDEKYSEFLWKLDKSKTITPEERKAYVGMYRMLTQIEKSDGAAIGSVIKAGKKLTLDNLMTAVRTTKTNGIDASVDESFGSLEQRNQKGESIEQQVEYYRRISSSILNKVEPEHLKNNAMSLEKLSETMEHDNNQEHLDYIKQRQEQLRTLMNNSEECISFLEANQQEVTMETVAAAEQLLSSGNWNDIYKRLDAKDQEAFAYQSEELISHLDSDLFDSVFDTFTDKIQNMIQKEKEKDTNSYKDLSFLRLTGSSLQLTGALAKKDNYNIPMMMGDQVGNVNVVVQHKEETGGKVEVSFESEQLGKVDAQFTVKNGEIKGFIITDNQPGLQFIRSKESAMANGFEALGLHVKQMDYSMISSKRQNVSYSSGDGDVSTKQLLQAAKIFIGIISEVERREV